MNFENIPPAMLQQLMEQLGGFDSQAEILDDSDDDIPDEQRTTPLTQDEIDLKLSRYLICD
jgi:hypothetical protein